MKNAKNGQFWKLEGWGQIVTYATFFADFNTLCFFSGHRWKRTGREDGYTEIDDEISTVKKCARILCLACLLIFYQLPKKVRWWLSYQKSAFSMITSFGQL